MKRTGKKKPVREGRPPMTRSKDVTESIVVKIVHCDLRHATHRLAVGHYQGDVIVNAESALDHAIGGALRHRFDLGEYPGPVGTSEIVRQGVHPPGGIVIGLGPVGELTPERLRTVFAAALRRHALAVKEDAGPAGVTRKPLSAAFSSVLVGTYGGASGGLPDAIHAIVRAALDANRSLKAAGFGDAVRIDEIELVEIYEDMAIRAAHVLAELPGPLAQELDQAEEIRGEPDLVDRPGGRFLRPADPYASGWWQRIAVRAKPVDVSAGAVPPSDATTALQFTMLTDRARLEQEISVGQRDLIQQLVTSATGSADDNRALSAALYQLIVPSQVKDRINRGGNLLLMVDRAGAAYPFELMAERTANGLEPIAKRRGILRQFETADYREKPEMARDEKILVLGNPATLLLADLPGAQAEAKEVAKVAAAKGLEVVEAPRDDAERTLVLLMTNDFRILHFAAHGQFNPDPMKSGVVISDRLLITPAEVAQLSSVPELVFLNCCYLGTMDAPRAAGPDPRLAASLAEGFIKAGARAVIAAGWAVDDRAGRTFAKQFYTEFLGGATFGDSVKAARDKTMRDHEGTNTWGAYQCYGNPDYRFRLAGVAPAGSASATRFVARLEALQALRTLASNVRSMRRDDVDRLAARFRELHEAAARWGDDGEVLSACGEICSELEQFEEAIDFYRKAAQAVPARSSFVAVEQLANLLSRRAAEHAAAGRVKKADEYFGEASEWLSWMDARLAPSKERWSLWGALHKRLAVSDTKRRREHLDDAASAYGNAARLGKPKAYELLNALALDFVRGSAKSISRLRPIVDGHLAAASGIATGNRQFWDIVGPADARLHRHVIYESLDGDALKSLTDEYAAAWGTGPSPREWASVRDHIAFLATMLADTKLECSNSKTAKALERLLSTLSAPKGRAG